MAAGSDPFNYVREWRDERVQKGWWHSFELPDGSLIDGVCSIEGLRNRLLQFPISGDLRGKRVLDIGTWDGWYAFELEKRGAEVMAIDCWDNPRFREMHRILNSRVDYREMDVYELTPDRIGQFDVVLFFGVLYHLKHPLLALERVCALTKDVAAVDSFVIEEKHRPGAQLDRRPVMEFYETSEFGGQTDNWVGPSLPCLMAFCRTAGFARVEQRSVLDHSACIACYRHWEPTGATGPSPKLLNAFHHTNYGINFSSGRDEYVTAHFEWDGRDAVTLDAVKPEVGGFGIRPIHLSEGPDHWQICFKWPPGLRPGWHEASLRIGDSAPSNARRLAVDIPAEPREIALAGLFDAHSWNRDEVKLSAGGMISVWLSGLPENADKNNVRAFLNGKRVAVAFVEEGKENSPRQLNAEIPLSVEPGEYELTFELSSVWTTPAKLIVKA